ncbi:hypothetical protein CONLIGDRAFT_2179 [Coniochaeta ligniaria NRRL 30616]|uniref:Uncharacterized protein n=1 Tax=Coniochaeta ligniaria NRRL 30616 TaxID=1408157 RepID=A0A1J7JWD4_9PEZI|nr:hypothetical protein CONLIGDRAFT_2179 [Coniochaeta ligniaria NRRL 30616]
MSQENLHTPVGSSAEARSSVSLILSNTPLPNPASWEHVVVSLSSRKQEQIMDGIGRSHSEESPFSTWSIVGEALSMALLSESAGLYVQSTLKLHRKDFLLFTRKGAAHEDGTAGILEVDFLQKLKGDEWQGHWQEARPTLAHFVRDCSFISWRNKKKQRGHIVGSGRAWRGSAAWPSLCPLAMASRDDGGESGRLGAKVLALLYELLHLALEPLLCGLQLLYFHHLALLFLLAPRVAVADPPDVTRCLS